MFFTPTIIKQKYSQLKIKGMTEEQKMIIEGAYLLGFEPTSDCLTDEQLYSEAENYIYLNGITQ